MMVYYIIKYKHFIENLLNVESHYLIAVDNNQIQGILPLMIQNGKFGNVINSLPFYGSNGGISSTNGVHDQLYQTYLELINRGYFCSNLYRKSFKSYKQ